MHLLRQMPSAAPGFPSRAEVLDAYARRSGIDIGDFRFYRALSVFRLAIVFRQLVNLYRRGVRTSPEFAGFHDVAEGLLDFAIAIVEGRPGLSACRVPPPRAVWSTPGAAGT